MKTNNDPMISAFERIGKAANETAQAFRQLATAFKSPPRNRAFDKIVQAQKAINRQLHSNGKADFRKVRKWVAIRNKWLKTFKKA